MEERGFTLLETVIAVAVVMVMAAAAIGITLGESPYADAAAARQFDAAFAYAKSLAQTSGNGATLLFAPRRGAGGGILSGFILSVYAGRPDGATPVPAGLAPVIAQGDASEATLGRPPFALFIDGSGAVSGEAGYPAFSGGQPTFEMLSAEPACPATGYKLSFSGAGPKVLRKIACSG